METFMKLGAFSISLSVKDIDASLAFYSKLGFEKIGGERPQNWLILRNAETTIGLFQGMFEKNMLTFNPGWDASCNPLTSFTDVRDLQQELLQNGVSLESKADTQTKGPASFVVIDPDGNPILIDQHV
jgi:catechol 2,3-dioxygenase-like lactoylglutathione lyase family enzyme